MEATFLQIGEVIDYTPASARSAGEVVQVAGGAGVCTVAIAANALGSAQIEGVVKVQKAQVAITEGQPVGWDEDGNPYGGIAGSGCATNVLASADFLMGKTIEAAISTDTHVYVKLNKYNIFCLTANSQIWVSPDGNDSADGSILSPVLTITKAFTLVTTARKKIMVMPGEYAEVDLVWPSTNEVELIGIGGSVIITQSTKAATAVMTIVPTSTSTFSATLTNIEIESDYTAGICLSIANSGMSANKKMIISLNNITLSTKNVTDSSLIIVNSVSSGAIRVYASGSYQIWEGLVDFTTANTGDRLRIYNHKIVGTLTMNEAVVSELTLIGVGIAADPTVHSNTLQTQINCWHESDADPDVYTEHANAYSA